MDNREEHRYQPIFYMNEDGTGRLGEHGADRVTIRRHNRQLILKFLRTHGPAPRVTIANHLSLSRATVTNIVRELEKEKWVREGDKVKPTDRGGRKATLIHFNEDAGYIIGVDLGRSRIRIYLANLEKIIAELPALFNIRNGWEETLHFIVTNMDSLIKTNLGTWNQVRGIGLSIPGTLDQSGRRLISPPLFQDWSDIDIPTYLCRKLNLDENFPIYLDKDANMGALAECRYGKGRGVKNLVYVKLSTGISAGLILNGQLYRGSNGLAGEIGHVLFNTESLPCPSCGKQGCLEAVAGLSAIVADAHRDVSHYKADSLILTESGEETEATSELMADVIIAAENGDAACRAALQRAGEHIGKAIGSYLINVYNPSMILLDGGIVRPNKNHVAYTNNLLIEALKQHAMASSLPAAWKETEISTGELGDEAVGLGAIGAVLDRDSDLNMLN